MDRALCSSVEILDLFDTEEERQNKIDCVKLLETLGTRWVREIAKDRNHDNDFGEKKSACRVMIQGSVALRVSCKTSDVDAVLIVPNFVDRHEFFTSFLDILKRNQSIQDLVSVPETFMPLIRMKVYGIPVDLVISCLSTPYVPCVLNLNLPPSELYSGMNQFSVRSLSGLHVAKTIKSVATGSPHFYNLLRIIRAWVSARDVGLYVYGFPPVIGWTVMVAYICKKFGSTTNVTPWCICANSAIDMLDSDLSNKSDLKLHKSSKNGQCSMSNSFTYLHTLTCLVYNFFAQFSRWPWPEPVKIAPIQVVPDLDVLSWDPQRNPQDERDLMPIITPVYPNKNTAFSVRRVTRDIVTEELKRGLRIVQAVIRGELKWSNLFEKYDIRKHYRHFVHLSLHADSSEELNVVGGLVDSRLRDLAQALEDEPHIHSTRIVSAKKSSGCSISLRRHWLIGMDIEPGELLADGSRRCREVDITGSLSTFYQILRERDASTDFGTKLKHDYLKRAHLTKFEL